jgi:hypothetical protein
MLKANWLPTDTISAESTFPVLQKKLSIAVATAAVR